MSDSVDGDGARGGPPKHSETGGGDRAPGHTAPAAAGGSAVPFEATVPPTRRQSIPRGASPPAPPAEPSGSPPPVSLRSTSELTGAPYAPADRVRFPDDDVLSRWLRVADWGLGLAEQAALFVVLGAVVLTAAAAALSDRVLGVPLGRWWFDVVRGGTFAIAILGAVFATYQRRHLAMDLVSRRLPPRSRLVLRIALAVFTMFVVGLLRRSGLHQLDTLGEESNDHLVSTRMIVWLLPIGASLIILHTWLHMVIDIDYLVRGKTPPERTRSGH